MLFVLTQMDVFRFECIPTRNATIKNTTSILNTDTMNLDNQDPVRTIYKQVPVQNAAQIQSMFDFLNNKVHVNCSFEGVRRLYDQFLKESQLEYKILKFQHGQWPSEMYSELDFGEQNDDKSKDFCIVKSQTMHQP